MLCAIALAVFITTKNKETQTDPTETSQQSAQKSSRPGDFSYRDTKRAKSAKRTKTAKLSTGQDQSGEEKADSDKGSLTSALVDFAELMETSLGESTEHKAEQFLAPLRERLQLTPEQEKQYSDLLAQKEKADSKAFSKGMEYLKEVDLGKMLTMNEAEVDAYLAEKFPDAESDNLGLSEEEKALSEQDESDLLTSILQGDQKKEYESYLEEREIARIERKSTSTLANIDSDLHLNSEQRDAVFERISENDGRKPKASELEGVLNNWQMARYRESNNPAKDQLEELREDKSVGLTKQQSETIMEQAEEKGRKLTSDELQTIISKDQYQTYQQKKEKETKMGLELLNILGSALKDKTPAKK